jgi:hypothetical protein
MDQIKIKGQKGFAIVNIIMGVILTFSSVIMFFEANAIGGVISLVLGLTILITGFRSLRFFSGGASDEIAIKKVKRINTICFVVSCVLMAMVIILPIVGPML